MSPAAGPVGDGVVLRGPDFEAFRPGERATRPWRIFAGAAYAARGPGFLGVGPSLRAGERSPARAGSATGESDFGAPDALFEFGVGSRCRRWR